MFQPPTATSIFICGFVRKSGGNQKKLKKNPFSHVNRPLKLNIFGCKFIKGDPIFGNSQFLNNFPKGMNLNNMNFTQLSIYFQLTFYAKVEKNCCGGRKLAEKEPRSG